MAGLQVCIGVSINQGLPGYVDAQSAEAVPKVDSRQDAHPQTILVWLQLQPAGA